MKRIWVILAIFLFPLSAMAGMSAITDSEMGAITGQMGVSIYLSDIQQDTSISVLTWGDENNGEIGIAGQPTAHSPGYINIQDLKINHQTIAVNAYKNGIKSLEAFPLTIDVISFGKASSASMPFAALQNKTAVVIGLPDLYQTIDSITIGSISLNKAK